MTTCASCGLENPDRSKFCTGCGAALAATPPAVAANCPGCGAANPADSKFCVTCGTPLRGQATLVSAVCPTCGAENSPGSKFCTGCGAAAGTAAGTVSTVPGGQTAAAGAPASLQSYLASLEARLAQSGFAPAEAPAALALDRTFRRKKIDIAKAGMLTTLCGIKLVPEGVNAVFVRQFSAAFFDFAAAGKGFIARSTFQPVLAYPVIVTAGFADDVEPFLSSYWPKHMMAYEYPVVIGVSTGRLAMHRSTPVWAMALHGGIRSEAERLFAL